MAYATSFSFIILECLIVLPVVGSFGSPVHPIRSSSSSPSLPNWIPAQTAALFAGLLCGSLGVAPNAHAFPNSPEKTALLSSSVLDVVEKKYFPSALSPSSRYDRESLDEAAAAAILARLEDPYSELLPKVNTATGNLVLSISGEQLSRAFGELGLTVVKDSKMPNVVTVVSVASHGAAEAVGLRVGDRIESIDTERIDSFESLSSISQRLSGASRWGANGEGIVLSIQRDGLSSPLSIRMPDLGSELRTPPTRQSLSFAATVPGRSRESKKAREGSSASRSIVYLRLDDFGPRASNDVFSALEAANEVAGETAHETGSELQTEMTGISGVVIDLRSNPGGLLDSAVDIASLFLPEGSPVAWFLPCPQALDTVRDSNPVNTPTAAVEAPPPRSSRSTPRSSAIPSTSCTADLVRTTEAPVVPSESPVVVLVDDESRSAAEVLAAALQEADRAVVVGSSKATFGKSTVQQILPVGDQGRKVKLTTARFLTPSGRSLDGSSLLSPRGGGEFFRSGSGRVVGSLISRGVLPDFLPTSSSSSASSSSSSSSSFSSSSISFPSSPSSFSRAAPVSSMELSAPLSSRSAEPPQSQRDDPETLLLKSGAFFDFAGEWCAKHSSLVMEATLQSSSALTSSDDAFRATTTATTTPVVSLLQAALADEQALFEDFKLFLRQRQAVDSADDVWRRAEADADLKNAKALLQPAIDPSSPPARSSSPSLSSSSSSSSAKSLIHQARVALRRDLSAAVERNPGVREACVARAKDAIRARFLSEDERRQETFLDEIGRVERAAGKSRQRPAPATRMMGAARASGALQFAFQLLAEDGRALYDAALSPPLDEVGETSDSSQHMLRRSKSSTAPQEPQQASSSPPGFEADAQCLPLQECTKEEFVYVSSI